MEVFTSNNFIMTLSHNKVIVRWWVLWCGLLSATSQV